VLIRYHAAARELAGVAEERLPISVATPSRDLSAQIAAARPRLAPLLDRMRLAINEELTTENAVVAPGDVVDVLPPVAGGSDRAPGVVLAAVRAEPLSIDEAFAAVSHPAAGGVALFAGVVRDHADGRAVAKLEYEAHATLAAKELRAVLERVVAEHPDVRLAAVHRHGALAVGDLAVIVAASAPPRADAFAACRTAIDRIKETVPIWKKEWGPDGDALWVNLER
jgi:molybdopterin synthase catalytic subunit/molybdopterin converting factor small subunit